MSVLDLIDEAVEAWLEADAYMEETIVSEFVIAELRC